MLGIIDSKHAKITGMFKSKEKPLKILLYYTKKCPPHLLGVTLFDQRASLRIYARRRTVCAYGFV